MKMAPIFMGAGILLKSFILLFLFNKYVKITKRGVMNVDSIFGIKSSAVIVLDQEIKKLKNRVVMSADISNKALFGMEFGKTVFSEKLNETSRQDTPVYFVINNIEKQTEEYQNRFVGLVKDREMNGYYLPQNIVIVFSVKNKDSIQKISKELYKFCDVLM